MWRHKNTRYIALFSVCVVAGISFFQNCAPQRSAVSSTGNEAQLVLPPSTEVAQNNTLEKVQVNPIIANRMLVANYFISIFGPSIETIVAQNIAFNADDFGSSHSAYDHVLTADCSKKARIDTVCSNTTTTILKLKTPANVGLNIRREAWRMQTCHTAVKNDGLLFTALKKIDPVSTRTSLPSVDDRHLNAAFELFFRAKPAPTQQILDALTIVAQQETEDLEKWRNIVLSLCLSPHWQVL